MPKNIAFPLHFFLFTSFNWLPFIIANHLESPPPSSLTNNSKFANFKNRLKQAELKLKAEKAADERQKRTAAKMAALKRAGFNPQGNFTPRATRAPVGNASGNSNPTATRSFNTASPKPNNNVQASASQLTAQQLQQQSLNQVQKLNDAKPSKYDIESQQRIDKLENTVQKQDQAIKAIIRVVQKLQKQISSVSPKLFEISDAIVQQSNAMQKGMALLRQEIVTRTSG